MSGVEQLLRERQVIGQLRQAARTATSKRRRDVLRAFAKKIEDRRRLNLPTSWWVEKATEEMMK